MKLNLVFLIVISFIVQFATGQITGKIQNTADNYPLEYGTAALYNQEDKSLVTGVLTNIDGVFVIENIKNGRYYLEASFVGYTAKTIQNTLECVICFFL